MDKSLSNVRIAWQAVRGNSLRSVLTALGIIFGVASVIAMMAIGRGTQVETLQQFELIGSNNLVITPRWGDTAPEDEESKGQSGGLDLRDVTAISKVVPGVKELSPEIQVQTRMVREGRTAKISVVGVSNSYFNLNNFDVEEGSFFGPLQVERGDPVCILGASVARKYFREENVIGERIKCGKVWLRVIGVLEARNISEAAQINLGIRDYDADIYVPIQTLILRFEDRSRLTEANILAAAANQGDDEGSENEKAVNYHQVDRITVQVEDPEYLASTADVVARLLNRRHSGESDFFIDIPIDKLEEQRKAKARFNNLLFLIAAISLLVGGIGIMNIMLASVLERIKEIGLRRSIGATKKDIVQQFLFESILICLAAGLIGVVLSVIITSLIEQVMGYLTIVTWPSILLAFLISTATGVLFGWLPARRAAEQDPIKSLRYES
jgi:putative ABC transport system permease protein